MVKLNYKYYKPTQDIYTFEEGTNIKEGSKCKLLHITIKDEKTYVRFESGNVRMKMLLQDFMILFEPY